MRVMVVALCATFVSTSGDAAPWQPGHFALVLPGETSQEEREQTMPSADPRLPLKSLDYRAKVRGLQADVQVTQTFDNKLNKSVEAIYVFPLPENASVLGVNLKIGSKTVEAELRSKKQARDEYNVARDQGHHAALLEQQRRNVFTMSVAGIEPSESVKATVRYMHPVIWHNGGGRMRIPLVVAPRFIPGKATGKSGGGWSPDTTEVPDASKITPKVRKSVSYHASMTLDLDPGFSAQVDSPTHGSLLGATSLESGHSRRFELKDIRTDRDVIVTYCTNEDQPNVKVDRQFFESNGKSEEFLMLTLTPPKSKQTKQKPRDVVLLLDSSGSMQGPKIAGLKTVAKKVLGILSSLPNTRVGIVQFSSMTQPLVPLSTLGAESSAHQKAVALIQAGGGTMTGNALSYATSMFGNNCQKTECSIILVTDGQTSNTLWTKKDNVRVHAIGLDSAVNDAFLADVARDGNGANEWLYPGEDYDGASRRIAGLTSGPVAEKIVVQGLPSGAQVVGVKDLFEDRPTTIAIKMPRSVNKFSVTGSDNANTPFTWNVSVPRKGSGTLPARVWAKAQIRKEGNNKLKTEISLKYGIVGSTTSFVAVSLKKRPGQKPERIDIPVLLPDTWEFERAWGGGKTGPRLLGAGPSSVGMIPTGGVPVSADIGIPVAASGSRGGGRGMGGGRGASGYALPTPAADVKNPAAKRKAADKKPLHQRSYVRLLKESVKRAKIGNTVDMNAITDGLKVGKRNRFSAYNELQKAELFLALAQLSKYGYSVPIPAKLMTKPRSGQRRALATWTQAMQLLGRSTN